MYAVARDPLIWEQHPARDRWKEHVFRKYFEEALNEVGPRDARGDAIDGAAAGRGGAFAVIERSSGRIIGCTRYHNYNPLQSEIEVGWTFLARTHWGGRFNRDMKRLLLDHAFTFVDRVIFLVGPGNIRSREAMERLGAVNQGIVHTRDSAGRTIDHVKYVIARSDWNESRSPVQ